MLESPPARPDVSIIIDQTVFMLWTCKPFPGHCPNLIHTQCWAAGLAELYVSGMVGRCGGRWLALERFCTIAPLARLCSQRRKRVSVDHVSKQTCCTVVYLSAPNGWTWTG